MHIFKCLGALALASSVLAQNVTYCPSGGVCYAVNVPASAASTGTGDIYFQISGPSSLSWIGLGQGSSMAGSNIFVIYADGAGTNVTLSPRLGTGFQQPLANPAADVTLLDGSGVSNGMMVANVLCSNCNNWSGGSMSFTDPNSNWIWAYENGGTFSSDSTSATISKHTAMDTTMFNLQNAAGGSSANPFFTSASASTGSSPSSSSSGSMPSASSGMGMTGGDGMPADYDTVRYAHAIMAPVAFVLLFPLGAMSIRLLSFKGIVWFHAGWMMLTYIVVLASMGMGVWMAVVSQQLDTTHAITGIAIVGGLLLQPITGLTHHLLYKKAGRPNAATYPHVWWGRAVITLGIVNGGLGLELSGNTTKDEIAYSVAAAFMWVLWMAVIVFAFIKSRGNLEDAAGDSAFSPKTRSTSTEMMRYPESPLQTRPTTSKSADEWPRAQQPRRPYR